MTPSIKSDDNMTVKYDVIHDFPVFVIFEVFCTSVLLDHPLNLYHVWKVYKKRKIKHILCRDGVISKFCTIIKKNKLFLGEIYCFGKNILKGGYVILKTFPPFTIVIFVTSPIIHRVIYRHQKELFPCVIQNHCSQGDTCNGVPFQ